MLGIVYCSDFNIHQVLIQKRQVLFFPLSLSICAADKEHENSLLERLVNQETLKSFYFPRKYLNPKVQCVRTNNQTTAGREGG